MFTVIIAGIMTATFSAPWALILLDMRRNRRQRSGRPQADSEG